MNRILFALLALTATSPAATLFFLDKNTDGHGTIEKFPATNSSLFGLDGSGNPVMVANTTFASADDLTDGLAAKANLAGGNVFTEGQAMFGSLTVEHSASPVLDIRRTTASTSSVASSGRITAISSGDAADGFGPLLEFRFSDTGISNNLLGAIGFVRAGADGTGDFVVRNQVAGSATERMRITSAGDIVLSGTGSTGTGGVVRATSPTTSAPTITGNIFIPSTEGGSDGVTIAQDTHPRVGLLGWPSTSGTLAIAAATSGRVAPSDMTGLGTGVPAALAVNIGSAGAPVLFNGAGGTPSSINLSNATNFPTLNQNTTGSAGSLSLSGGGTVTGASGAVTLTASGTNQNVSISPSGTGAVVLPSNSKITIPRTSFGAILEFGGSNQLEYIPNNILSWKIAGTGIAAFRTTGLVLNSSKYFGATSADTDGTVDTTLGRASAGVWEMGAGGVHSLKLTNLTQSGIHVTTPDSRSGAGAVSVTTSTTAYTSTGAAQALTLADGTAGQIKTIVHVSDGGDGVLTPTTKSGYTSVTFTAAGDSLTLQFFTTAGWCIIGSRGVTITP